jgi:hypothetical protein
MMRIGEISDRQHDGDSGIANQKSLHCVRQVYGEPPN